MATDKHAVIDMEQFERDCALVTAAGESVAKSSNNHKYGAGICPKGAPPHTGLLNQGGTCYLNSLLQALFACSRFREAVFDWRHNPAVHGPAADSLPFQLQQLFAQMALSDASAVSTEGLTKSFGWTSEDAFVQHDVQELCRVLFDAIERSEELSSAASNSESSTKSVQPVTAAAPSSALDLREVVQNSFMGDIADKLTCDVCGTSRMRTDRLADISLSVSDLVASVGSATPTLADALHAYLAPEKLAEGDAVMCETCGKRCNSTKQQLLLKAPPCLFVHLKRFAYDVRTGRYTKLTDKIELPVELDLSPHLTASPDSLLAPVAPHQLSAVLMHSGTAGSGHYFAFVKDAFCRRADGQHDWLLLNDAGTMHVSAEAFLAALNASSSPDLGSGSSSAGAGTGTGGATGGECATTHETILPSVGLAKPQFAEDAAVRPGGHTSQPSSVPKGIPKNGTPYLLLYVDAAHVPTPFEHTASYATACGVQRLPADMVAAIVEDNSRLAQLRALADARSRLCKIQVSPPVCLNTEHASSDGEYSGSKPFLLWAPLDASLGWVTERALEAWISRDNPASTAGAPAPALSLPHVRLRRFERGARMHLDTFSSPEALGTSCRTAGFPDAVDLSLQYRPDVSVPWLEFDPHALTLRVFRWSPALQALLEARAAAATAAASCTGEAGMEESSLTPPGDVSSDVVEAESCTITLPGVSLGAATLDDLAVAVAVSPLGIPAISQRLILMAGGLPYLNAESGSGGESLLLRRSAIPLFRKDYSSLVARDCGAMSGDALIVEVDQSYCSDGGHSSSAAFDFLFKLCASDTVTVTANLLLPDGVRLKPQSSGGSELASTPALPHSADESSDGGVTGSGSSGDVGSGGAGATSAAATSSLALAGIDTSGMDDATRLAIAAALEEDEGSSTRTSGGGSGGRQAARAGTPQEEGEYVEYSLLVQARRQDTLGAVKARIVAAINEELKRLFNAGLLALPEEHEGATPPRIDASRTHLSRGPRMLHFRNEALRLHDLDIGHLSSLLVSHGAPLGEGVVVLQPLMCVGATTPPTVVVLPKLSVQLGNRVSYIRRQVASHVNLALDKLRAAGAPGVTGWSTPLPPASLRLRTRNAPRLQRLTTAAPILPSQYGGILRDESSVRSACQAMIKTLSAASSGGEASAGVDTVEVLVELLLEPEVVGPDDLIVKLREYRPASDPTKSKGSLGPIAERVFPKTASLADFRAAISRVSGKDVSTEVLSVVKAPSFGPPLTAAIASALKWEPLYAAEAGDGVNTEALTPLLSHSMGLKDGHTVLWRCGAVAADAGSSGKATGHAAKPWLARGRPTGGDGSAGAGGGDNFLVTKPRASGGAATGKREQGVHIK